MAPPPSIHRQFLVALIISLPLIGLLILASSYLENGVTPTKKLAVPGEGEHPNVNAPLAESPINTAPDDETPLLKPKSEDTLTAKTFTKSSFLEEPSKEDCDHLRDMPNMVNDLDRGRFPQARRLALQIQEEYPLCQSSLAKLYVQHADAFLATKDSLSRLDFADPRPNLVDSATCWNPYRDDDKSCNLEEAANIVLDKWDLCCSRVASTQNDPESDQKIQEECEKDGHRLCCDFYQGSLSYLRLPALQETTVHLKLDRDQLLGIILQQDGFLRKFDPAGVLWPTGYLLSICLADPSHCGIPELFMAAESHSDDHAAIELGAGIGAPSIVLSKLLQERGLEARVLATDRALHALALTATNSHAAGASVLVKQLEDHSDLAQLEKLGGGYAIVLGSSLQSLFDWNTRDPNHTLWEVLDKLLDKENPQAIAILAHINGAVVPPKEEGASFELVRTISGNHLGMWTRSGDDSDFAISIYRRKAKTNDKGTSHEEM